MKAYATKIINGISIVILVLALVILLTSVLTGKGNVPQLGGYSVFKVMTGSMEPEIMTNSLILVERVDGEGKAYELEKDQIICFYSSDPDTQGLTVTHRIVKVEGKGDNVRYVTKGDANAVSDRDEVAPSQVVGIVKWDSHFLGMLVKLMMNPLVFFPVIVIPLLVMIILNLRDSVRAAKKLAREEEEAAVREAVEKYKTDHEE